MLRVFLRNWNVRIGLGIFGFALLVAFAGPWFVREVMGTSGRAIDYDRLGEPPSLEHPLGMTLGGSDVLAQVIIGAQGSVFVGLLSGTIAVGLGILVGVPGGFLGGRTDQALTMLTNVFLTLPGFPLILIIAGYVQGAPWWLIATIIGVFGWPGGARYLRSQTLSLRTRDFVIAMRMLGETRRRLVFVEIMPHLTGILSAMFLGAMVGGIFAEAGLSFLGVGVSGTITWGTIISEAQSQSAILNGLWWWFIPPGLCIALLGMATALVNFGIDTISNPRLNPTDRKLVRRFHRLRGPGARRRPRADRSGTDRPVPVGAAREVSR